MNPKIKVILDSLEQMTPGEVHETWQLLRERFGLGGSDNPGPDNLGSGVPKVPISPDLMGVQRN